MLTRCPDASASHDRLRLFQCYMSRTAWDGSLGKSCLMLAGTDGLLSTVGRSPNRSSEIRRGRSAGVAAHMLRNIRGYLGVSRTGGTSLITHDLQLQRLYIACTRVIKNLSNCLQSAPAQFPACDIHLGTIFSRPYR